jgi:hypothetical protein
VFEGPNRDNTECFKKPFKMQAVLFEHCNTKDSAREILSHFETLVSEQRVSIHVTITGNGVSFTPNSSAAPKQNVLIDFLTTGCAAFIGAAIGIAPFVWLGLVGPVIGEFFLCGGDSCYLSLYPWKGLLSLLASH